jgi:hypothetical protein
MGRSSKDTIEQISFKESDITFLPIQISLACYFFDVTLSVKE